jgi:hypothetical protein
MEGYLAFANLSTEEWSLGGGKERMKTYNMNNTVYYKLTPKGKEILSNKYTITIKYYFEEWVKDQLWCAFQVFGPHIRLGLGDVLIKELTFEDPLAINETTQTRSLIRQDNGDNINKGLKMNKEQLNKIIALHGALEDAEFLLNREENEIFVVPTSHNYCGSEPKKLRFSKSAFLVYCDKIKQELKELGYEE